ncbi:MAG: ATP synthase subunit I [Chloracidobacterium sp.]|nr:ATP synthase subunit I [Chloracidobacterium sp.]
MAMIVVVGAAAGLAFAGARFGLGVLFGGLLAFGNYFWLERVTRQIFQPDAVRSTGILAAKYILRYLAIGGVLLLVYLTGAFPMPAVILGLSAFAIAIVAQGLKNIVSSKF